MDPLPARMINAFVYCPRLFYLEHVQGRFEDSDETVEGRARHRSVDQPRGGAPTPDEGVLHEARSVSLSSPALGLSARIDLLEGRDGAVIPVEVKRGHPRADGQPWPSDHVQIVVQALLLEKHGYRCTSAAVYYASTQQRVTVEITDEDRDWARSCANEARAAEEQVRPPPPLVDSPKCTRCSLSGICLPDETNLLTGQIRRQPKRILPRDPDTRPLYVSEPGSTVGVRRGQLFVRKDGEQLANIRLLDVAQLAVFGPVQISTPALHTLFDCGVPVLWFSYGGWLKGWSCNAPTSYAELRRRQTTAHAQAGLGVPNRFIEGKIRNARTMLRRNLPGQPTAPPALSRLAAQAREATTLPELLGIEGAAARLYFESFSGMLNQSDFALAFHSGGRNRRPPLDPVNALLSFCYALLTKDLVATALGVGFDPYLGLYHRTRHNRPALALDLAEEFRPLLADSTVLQLINHHEIAASDFTSRAGAVSLTRDGRRTVIRAYERRLNQKVRHPQFGYTISYRRVLEVQTRLLAATLIGEIDEYPPMTSR